LAPALGAAALVATLLLDGATPRVVRGWLVAVHLVFAPLFLVSDQGQAIAAARRSERMVAASDLDGDVVVLATPDPFIALYPPYIETAVRTPRYTGWQVLSFAPLDLEVERTAADELRLRAMTGHFFESPQERLLHDGPIAPGTTVEQAGLEAHVSSPAEVAFHFRRPLEGVNLVYWVDGRLRHLPLPPVGTRVIVRKEPGIMGL
jgi:hypothetical protein